MGEVGGERPVLTLCMASAKAKVGEEEVGELAFCQIGPQPPICVRILFSGEQYAVEVQGTQQNAGQSDKLRKFAKSVHGVENLPN